MKERQDSLLHIAAGSCAVASGRCVVWVEEEWREVVGPMWEEI
jgi:hypothetical protein